MSEEMQCQHGVAVLASCEPCQRFVGAPHEATERDALRAEVERMRAVVDAAKKTVAVYQAMKATDDLALLLTEVREGLWPAVDALDSEAGRDG